MLKLVTDATVEPITLADVKNHLRVTISQDDNLISSLILAARQMIERDTGRALMTQTWDYWMDSVPCTRGNDPWWDGVRDGALNTLFAPDDYVDLKMAPVQSITYVNYYDFSNAQGLYASSNYFLDNSEPNRLCLNIGSVWPAGIRNREGIQIRFVAGYGSTQATGATAGSVPSALLSALKLIVGHLYENRGDQEESTKIPPTAQLLISPYKLRVMR